MINLHEVYENISFNMSVMYNFIFNDLSGNIFYSSLPCKKYSSSLIVIIVIEMEDFRILTFSMDLNKHFNDERIEFIYIHGSSTIAKSLNVYVETRPSFPNKSFSFLRLYVYNLCVFLKTVCNIHNISKEDKPSLWVEGDKKIGECKIRWGVFSWHYPYILHHEYVNTMNLVRLGV